MRIDRSAFAVDSAVHTGRMSPPSRGDSHARAEPCVDPVAEKLLVDVLLVQLHKNGGLLHTRSTSWCCSSCLDPDVSCRCTCAFTHLGDLDQTCHCLHLGSPEISIQIHQTLPADRPTHHSTTQQQGNNFCGGRYIK
jgi:hypothetical protein